jgi:hypothetical protein
MIGYQAQVIPAMLAGFLLAYLEIFFRKVIPQAQLPIVQPIGPKMTCAANTVGTKANNGTKIIEIA